jgi:hypothetical protein
MTVYVDDVRLPFGRMVMCHTSLNPVDIPRLTVSRDMRLLVV